MTRVIVHAGYHKTGTTSLQDFFTQNRAALAPYLAYYGKADFLRAGTYARIYAQRPFPWRLRRFRRAFRVFLAGIEPAEVIVLSRETFSGGMPGHRQFGGRLMTSYFGTARRLAEVIVSELRRRFGSDVEITFFYTTRAREDWIASVHGHLLRSIQLTDDFDQFRARFPALASPEEEAARMRGVLSPVPVVTAALEDWRDRREGPAGAILDLLDVPAQARAELVPAPKSNSGQSAALRAQFLDLNRKGLSKADVKHSKAALIRPKTTGAD